MLTAFSETIQFSRGFVSGIFTLLILEGIALLIVVRLLSSNDRVTKPVLGERSKKYPLPEPSLSPPTSQLDAIDSGIKDVNASPNVSDVKQSEHSLLDKSLDDKNLPEHVRPWPLNVITFLKRALIPTVDDIIIPSPTSANVPSSSTSDSSTVPRRRKSFSSQDFLHLPGQEDIQTDGSMKKGDTHVTILGDTEPVEWLNIVLFRFFLTLRGSLLFKTRWTERISTKMNSKLKGNSFVSQIQMSDLCLGDHPPRVHGIRVVKGVSSDLAVLLELDITYEGGANLQVDVHVAGGMKIPARVTVNSFSGRIRSRFPSVRWSDMYAVSFVEDPGISFEVQVQTESDMLRSLVNKVLSSILRKTFLELWVLPSWRTFFFPQLQPSPEQIKARISKTPTAQSQQQKVEGSKVKPKLVSKAANLWESRGALRKNHTGVNQLPPSSKDAFESSTFAIDATLTGNIDEGNKLGSALVSTLLKVADDTEASIEDDTTSSMDTMAPNSPVISQEEPQIRPSRSASLSRSSSPSRPSTASSTKTITATMWKSVRSKAGILIQKKKVMNAETGALSGEVVRAKLTIHCDAGRVFSVLSNPEHFRHVYDTYVGSDLVHEYDETKSSRLLSFLIGKANKSIQIFETHQKLPSQTDADSTKDERWVVVFRSIGKVQLEGEENGSDLDGELNVSKLSKKENMDNDQISNSTGEISRENIGSVKDADPEAPNFVESLTGSPNRKSNKLVDDAASTSSESASSRGNPQLALVDEIAAQSLPELQGQMEGDSETVSNPSMPVITVSRPSVVARKPTRTSSESTTTSPPPVIFLYGYSIQPSTSDPQNQTVVTIVAQFDQRLQKLEPDYASCRRIKQFIEELDQLAKLEDQILESGGEMRRRRIFGFGNDLTSSGTSSSGGEKLGPDGKRIDKIKHYLGNTANYLMKGRKGVSWLVKSLGSAPNTDEFSHSPNSQGDEEESANFEEVFQNVELPNEELESWRSNADDSCKDILSSNGDNDQQASQVQMLTSIEPVIPISTKDGAISTTSSSPNSLSDLRLIRPRSSLIAEMTEFEREPYVERLILPKDIVRVEIPFSRSSYGADVVLEWEFMSRTDAPVHFGISYSPDTNPYTKSTQLLPILPSTTTSRVIFPLSSIQTYTHPTYGSISVSDLNSGVFTFVWDNVQSQNKKTQKRIAYKCLVHNTVRHPENIRLSASPPLRELSFGYSWLTSAEITVSRKSFAGVPHVVDNHMLSILSNTEGSNSSATLLWEFSTGGMDINFGICFLDISTLSDNHLSETDLHLKSNDDPISTQLDDSRNADSEPLDDSASESRLSGVSENSAPPLPPRPSAADHESSAEVSVEAKGPETSSRLSRAVSLKQAAKSTAVALLQQAANHSPAGGLRSAVASKLAARLAGNRSSTPPPTGEPIVSTSPPSSVLSRSSMGLVNMEADLSSSSNGYLLGNTTDFHFPELAKKEWKIPLHKVNSSKGEISGSITIEKPGVYLFVFDNTFSLVTSRNVSFRVGVALGGPSQTTASLE